MPPARRNGALAGAAVTLVLLLGLTGLAAAGSGSSGSDRERRSIDAPPLAALAPEVDPARAPAGMRGDAAAELLERARLPVADGTSDPGPAPLSAQRTPAAGRSALTGIDVNTDLRRAPGSQASSAIALAPEDPLRALAASNDAVGGPQLIISDAGLAAGSQRLRRMPQATDISGEPQAVDLEICCEPAVASDGAGGFWVAATVTGPQSRIVLNRVLPGSSALRARNVGLPASSAGPLQHMPALAADPGRAIVVGWVASSPTGDRVVVSECDLTGGAGPCQEPDGWSDPLALTGPGGAVAMPDLAYGPDGELYATWWDAGADNAVEAALCPAGESCSEPGGWGPEVPVAALDLLDDDGNGSPDPLPLRCPIIAAPGGLVGPSPRVAVTPSGRALIVYSDLRDNGAPDEDTRCTAAGSDRTFDSFLAAAEAPGSLPGEESAVRLSGDDPLDLNDHFLPAPVVDPDSGRIAVSFHSTAADPSGQHALRVLVSSDDDGESFSAPEPVSSEPSRFAGSSSDGVDYGDRQGIAAAAGTIRPAWTDARALQGHDGDLYALAPPVEAAFDSAPTGILANAIVEARFSSAAPHVRCALNGAAFTPCSSPLLLGPLPNRAHTLRIRATDGAGNVVSSAAAQADWEVRDLTPPETTITKRPRKRIKAKRPLFRFVASEQGASFECRYDRLPWQNCKTPRRAKVSVGRHTFRVRATDVGGNTDATPAVAKVRRMPKCWSRKHGRKRC